VLCVLCCRGAREPWILLCRARPLAGPPRRPPLLRCVSFVLPCCLRCRWCVLWVVWRAQQKLVAANLGDSGFMIIRSGRTIFKSPRSSTDFNSPSSWGARGPPRHR